MPGLDRDAVSFQVVSEGERGLLGVGFTPALVVASVDVADVPTASPPEPGEESAEAALVRELLERTIAATGVSATVLIDDSGEELIATLAGPDLGVLIGRHGQTIDALQYLANAIGHRTRARSAAVSWSTRPAIAPGGPRRSRRLPVARPSRRRRPAAASSSSR